MVLNTGHGCVVVHSTYFVGTWARCDKHRTQSINCDYIHPSLRAPKLLYDQIWWEMALSKQMVYWGWRKSTHNDPGFQDICDEYRKDVKALHKYLHIHSVACLEGAWRSGGYQWKLGHFYPLPWVVCDIPWAPIIHTCVDIPLNSRFIKGGICEVGLQLHKQPSKGITSILTI